MGTLTSLTTPIIALWVHELTAVTAEMEVIHVLSIVDFLSKKADLTTLTAECPILARNCSRDQCEPLEMILFPRWKNPATESYYIGILPQEKGSTYLF